MKKSLLASAFSVLFSGSALAEYTIDVTACAGTEMVQNSAGQWEVYNPAVHTVDETTPVRYERTLHVPPFFLASNRNMALVVTNVTSRDVTVIYTPTYYAFNSGQPVTLSPERIDMAFDGSNNPLSPQGALLASNTTGRIGIDLQSASFYGRALIKWESDTCGGAPLLATLEQTYYQNYSGGRGGWSVTPLNNGAPF
ncbi:hypothetical protein LJ739_18630 [Aestuariibacter halophilus]|uniref:Uncharacterized protein n=1 Tax=Fluctibacter halophilus TaxID=226011 RepID=A0ABS8GES0_9ALTE|nr:hypothetical protein [Aestuariibacter halophilus]MCC2618279.1 hypothetical protein [Aestuariibacter halophilus]